jgi:hypothetical protein
MRLFETLDAAFVYVCSTIYMCRLSVNWEDLGSHYYISYSLSITVPEFVCGHLGSRSSSSLRFGVSTVLRISSR